MRLLALVATVSVLGSPARPQTPTFCADGPGGHPPARLIPIDEASTQPDFFTFRAQLQVAVAARDIEAIVAVADPHIRLGFGGEEGLTLLRQLLGTTSSSDQWSELARVLALGGAFRSATSFEAPYYFAKWPQGTDAMECGVVIGSKVNVRREPSTEAPIVASADYAIVRQMGTGLKQALPGWAAIELANGTKGYVRSEYLRGGTSLRAIFNVVNGRWRLTALVAGD